MPRQRKTAGAFVVWKSDQAGAQKKGQGAMPLAGCRGGAPAGVWGNAPTVPRQTHSKGITNKGAGSEASLPLTSRSLRSPPKPLYPTTVLCRAKWARPSCWSCDHSRSFPNAGISLLRERQGGFAVAPLTPSQCTPMLLDFISWLFNYDAAFSRTSEFQNRKAFLCSRPRLFLRQRVNHRFGGIRVERCRTQLVGQTDFLEEARDVLMHAAN